MRGAAIVRRTSLLRRPALTAAARRVAAMAPPPAATADAYTALTDQLKEIHALGSIEALISWDEMVMLPPGDAAASLRAAQKAALAGVVHAKATAPELGDLLAKLQAAPPADDKWAAANVRLAAKDYKRATAIPAQLAKDKAALESKAYSAWVAARSADDFSKFAPALKEVFDMATKIATLVDPAKDPYDVMLDEFEPGCTAARLEPIMAAVEAAVVPLLKLVKEHGVAPPPPPVAPRPYDKDAQAELCVSLATALGFDTDAGRVDVSPHPFTGGSPGDVRMTTRYKIGATLDHLAEGITGTTHECGHALYEMSLAKNADQSALPAGRALSLGAHESQSLFWERAIGLSKAFCSFLAPRINEAFPDHPPLDAETLFLSLNETKTPSYIRVEADELHYPLHIILRFRIERALVDGSLKVEDLPAAWNEASQRLLGVTPPSDSKGVGQDMHWGGFAIGYFPTYLSGALASAQIWETAAAALGGEAAVYADIEAGRFDRIRGWLADNVHSRGSVDPSLDAWLMAITGSPLSVEPFLRRLKKKVVAVYKLDEAAVDAAIAPGLAAAAALR